MGFVQDALGPWGEAARGVDPGDTTGGGRKLPPVEWQEKFNIRVIDRAGWSTVRHRVPRSWADPITEREFWERAALSTVTMAAAGRSGAEAGALPSDTVEPDAHFAVRERAELMRQRAELRRSIEQAQDA